MALEISGNIELEGGVTLSSCYGRTFYKVYINSNEVKIGVQFFASKSSYENGLGSITPIIPLNSVYPYDRNVDGVDVLDFTQNKIKTELELLGYSVEITGL